MYLTALHPNPFSFYPGVSLSAGAVSLSAGAVPLSAGAVPPGSHPSLLLGIIYGKSCMPVSAQSNTVWRAHAPSSPLLSRVSPSLLAVVLSSPMVVLTQELAIVES